MNDVTTCRILSSQSSGAFIYPSGRIRWRQSKDIVLQWSAQLTTIPRLHFLPADALFRTPIPTVLFLVHSFHPSLPNLRIGFHVFFH